MSDRITLGFLINQIDSGYATPLLEGARDWVREHDANLVVFSGGGLRTPYGHEYQNNVVFEYIKPGIVDGLIIATSTQCNYMPAAQFHDYMGRFGRLPAVSLGIKLEGVPSILVDNRTGVRQAVEHLVDVHGFNRIAFIMGPTDNDEAVERFEAYREALSSRSLKFDPELAIQGDFTFAGARLAMTKHLNVHGRPNFQALIGANDESAIAAVKLLTERGYAVPRDIAVIGFDNIPISRFMIPPVTTIAQPLYEEAQTAADLLVKLMRGESVPETVVITTKLILRTSCGCLPRAVLELDGLARAEAAPVRFDAPRDKQAIIERCLVRLQEKEFSLHDKVLRDLLEALIELLGTDGFVGFLHGALSDAILRGADISAWQTLLTVLHEELALTAATNEEKSLLDIGFHKARSLLAEMLLVEQGKGRTDLREHLVSLRNIMERLISAASIEELMKELTEDLERLDIHTCLIAGYTPEVHHRRGDEWVMPVKAEVMLSCLDGNRKNVSNRERAFPPARNFIPPVFLPKDRKFFLIAISLYFREDQIGYILFEPGGCDNVIYTTFCVQLSNILKGSLLFMARQKAEEKLRQVLVELEEYNQKLSGLSQTDELTGLLNRRGFISLGRQSLTLARRMGRRGNVFFADMDDLKKINDGYGHQEGDAAIRAAADMLRKTFRNMDVIARLGGDEFAVLTVDTIPDFVESLRQRLQAAISTHNVDSGKPYELSMSIGTVPFEKESTVSLEELLDRADDVLYEEKKLKKGLQA